MEPSQVVLVMSDENLVAFYTFLTTDMISYERFHEHILHTRLRFVDLV